MTKTIIIMGVSGSGKSSVGQQLADKLGMPFFDADDFHPPENVARMAKGIPLTDEDRVPWLLRLRDLLRDHQVQHQDVVLACSALRQKYRDLLTGGIHEPHLVFLEGDFDLIWRRMQVREGHYMKASMLQSQFDVLEPPTPEEAIVLPVDRSIDELVSAIIQQI